MEHFNTLQTGESRANKVRWRLWCMMLLATFMTTVSGYGQIAWQPGIDLNLVKSGLDEGEKLDVYFATGSAISDGTVKITLPKGITTTKSSGLYEGASVSSNYEIASVDPSGDLTIVTCTIKNSLSGNDEVHFQLPVWASCDAVDGKIKMQVQDAGTDTGDPAERNILIEELDITAVLAIPSESDWTESDKTYAQKLTINSLNGHIASLTIQLKADATYDLKNFKLNGSDLTSTQVGNKDDSNTYTITLSDLNLATAILTFSSAHPAAVGQRSLSAIVVAACDAKPTVQPSIEFTVSGDAGTPKMNYIRTTYVSSTSGDPLVYGDGTRHLWDGTTLHYMKVVYQNNGDGAAVYTKTNFLLYNSLSAIMKDKDIFYRIGGSELLSSPTNTPIKVESSGLSFATAVTGILLQPLQTDIATNGVRTLSIELSNTPIAPGEYIAYYVPIRSGKIYATDAESIKKDAYRVVSGHGLYCLRTNVTEVRNARGETGVADWLDARTSRISVPSFRTPYDALVVSESERIGSNDIQKIQTANKISAGTITSEYFATLRIQKPDWVNITISGTNISKATDTEYKITGALSDLTYTYDFPNTGKPSENTTDSIRFFLDYSINTGSYQETLNSLARITQPIYYIVTPETIELVSFKAERQDAYIGLKPSDESTPLGFYPLDGTTKADRADKTIFAAGDLGTMSWEARITATTVAAGQTLYLPVQFAPRGASMRSGGTVKIVRGGNQIEAGTPQYVSVEDSKGYIKYIIQAALVENDVIRVEVPFSAISMNLRGQITSECKLGANNVNPFTATGLEGVDVKTFSIGTYDLASDLWGTYAANYTFTGSDRNKALTFSSFSFANNGLGSPWFPYEVRQVKYLKAVTITVPKGYRVDPASLKLYGPGRDAANSKLTVSVTPDVSETTNSNGQQVLTIDVKKEFDNKIWPYPDEKFYQLLDYNLIATSEVSPGNQTLTIRPTFADHRSGQADYSVGLTQTLTYNGYVISPSHNSSVVLDDPSKTDINITVENSTPGNSITGNWLYLEGADLSITSAEAEGQSLPVVGNYIKLGDASSSLSIGAGKNVVVKLELNYTGTTDGQVKVHTLSGWDNASFDPSGVSDINSTTLDANRSRTSEFSLIYPSTRINGSLSVSEYVFESAGDEYTLTAKISSASSQGTLVNPVMEIKTLKGHTFVPTSGNLTYGGNTYTVTPSDFEPIMDGPDVVGFTFDMRKVSGVGPGDVLFPGYTDQSTGASLKKEAVLSFKYSIGCDASMAGVGYTGTLKGSSLSGVAVTDKTVNSQKQYPKVTLPYEFDIALTTSTGNKAFSKESATEAIQIEVKLKENPTIPVKVGDFIEIELPDFLDLNGNITWTGKASGSLNKDDSQISNTPGSGKRTISFPLTHAAYTAKNDAVIFNLPVTYTETAANKATIAGSPISTITAKVMTIETIGLIGCPSPTAQEISAGNGTMDMAFVVFSQDDVMNIFVNGNAQTLSINSQDFNGKFSLDGGTTWSANATSTQVEDLRTSNHDNGFPTDGSGVTKEILIDVEFSGYTSSFGKIKFTYTLYPSLKYTLSKTVIDADCGSTKVTLDDLVTKESQYADVFFYTDGACTSKVNGTDQEKELFTETTFYVRSENTGGKETINPASTVTVKVNTDLGGVSVSAINTSVIIGETLTLTAAVTTPANIPSDAIYSWYKDGLFIETTTGLTYTKTASAITESGNYHLVITSPTKGLCNNVSSPVTISVTDRPANITLGSFSGPIYDCGTNATLNLYSLIANSASYISGEKFFWNIEDNTAGATEFTSTISLTATYAPGESYTVYVWAKNAAGNFSAAPASLSVTAIQYESMGIPAATISANTLEIPAASGSTGTVTISVASVTGSPATGGYTYKLYDASTNTLVGTSGNGSVGANSVQQAATTHTFTLTYDVPSAASKSYSYYVTVTGACNESVESNSVSVTVYPEAEIILGSTTTATYCQDDAALSDISLYTYIQGANSYLTYEYQLDGGNWIELTSSSVIANESTPDTYTYALRSFNANGTYSAMAPEVTIIVQKKTTILGISGNEVTEGQPINIVVSAEGEGTLSYEWYEGSSTTPLDITTTNIYQITPSASIAGDNGKTYRVVVKGTGVCSEAESTFRLTVNSSSVPPSGNYQVSWNVIGYGKVEVTADGISIRSGSHVNKGTKLMVYATTWKSNVLDWVTVNGTTYTSSPITYTVGEVNVNIVANFNGTDPDPDPDSNADIENGNRIWTEGGYACIYTETATRARVVTFNGRLVTDQKVGEGESRIQLPDGYYIVTLSDGTTRKIAIRNF